MSEMVQWENGMAGIPLNAVVEGLDQLGREGWELSGIIGADNTTLKVLVKRHKRAITLATTMPNGPITS